MSNIINISGIECYEDGGTAYLKLEAVARGLGFTKTETKNETEYTSVRWERVFAYLDEIGFDHKWAKDMFIPENVFYRLAMKAKNETAERFQAFIADEVVPSIRRHGAYMTPGTLDQMIASPEFGIRLLSALKDERDKRLELETANAALLAENAQQRQAIEDFKPVREYVDTILQSEGTLATSQIAADYDLSAKRLNRILREEGIQRSVNGQWILYREHMGKGYTKSKTFHFTHSDGRPDTKMQTQWTQKGRLLIHQILTQRGIIAVMDRRSAM